MARRPPKPEQQELARERIRLLFDRAQRAEPAEARRLVVLARRVATRSAVKVPAPWNRRFCRRCSALLTARTSRTRTSAKQRAVVVTCLSCGAVRRRPYRRERGHKA